MTDQELLGRLNGLSFIVEMALVKAHQQDAPLERLGLTLKKRDIILGELTQLLVMTEELGSDPDFKRGMLATINLASGRIDEIMRMMNR